MSPTAPSTTFSAYRKRMGKSSIPLLGELVWFTVTENICLDYQAFVDEATRLDLPGRLPKQAKDVDVFQRVCTNAQRKRVPVPGETFFANYLVRPVRNAGGHFWKQIVIEIVDGDNRRLSYEPAAELHFDPDKPNVIGVTWIGTKSAAGREIVKEIATEYDRWRGKLHAYSVRHYLREVIDAAQGTSVKPSGGLYFVPASQLDIIAKLDELINTFTNAATPFSMDLTLGTVPLPDDARQKAMLRAAFEDETITASNDLIKEIDDLVTNGKMTANRWATLQQRRQEIEDKASTYAEILTDNLEGTKLRRKALESKIKKAFAQAS